MVLKFELRRQKKSILIIIITHSETNLRHLKLPIIKIMKIRLIIDKKNCFRTLEMKRLKLLLWIKINILKWRYTFSIIIIIINFLIVRKNCSKYIWISKIAEQNWLILYNRLKRYNRFNTNFISFRIFQ